jgi:hypothetical protein
MRTKLILAIIVIIGFVVLIPSQFLPAIDAPHNESNNVYCGSCHGQAILNSIFWGGSGTYEQICLSCHWRPSGPYSAVGAPLVTTHSSAKTSPKYGDWAKECLNCHDPHYQLQKNYKNTDPNNYYLAKGTIASYTCNCDGTYNSDTGKYNNDGTSTLTYSSITYKDTGRTEWVWDAETLTQKTGNYRRTILFPNLGKLGYSYPITAVDTNTITVKGNATSAICPQSPTVCPVPDVPYTCTKTTNFAVLFGQYIKNNFDATVVGDIMDVSMGSGEDGSVTINTVKNLNTDTIAGGRSYPDGVNWQITNNVASGQTTISSDMSRPDGFAIGDEIIIINLKGTSTNYSGVGLYEFKKITALPDSASVTVDSNLTNSYDGTTQKIMVQRVPHYSNVTINTGGSITCNAWDGNKGGVVAFRASGTVTVNAPGGISASGLGFRGGIGTAYNQNAGGGETYNGTGGAGGADGGSGLSGQGGGGGAGAYVGGSGGSGSIGGSGGGGGAKHGSNPLYPPGGGGGGGYSSVGSGGVGDSDGGGEDGAMGSGAIGGTGGDGGGVVDIYSNSGSGGGGGGGTYGLSDLSLRLYLGSSGGAGGGLTISHLSFINGANGGNGGGIVYVSANTININSTGSIKSDGIKGDDSPSVNCSGASAGGAGGTGGSVALFAHQFSNGGNITADGGIGGFYFECASCCIHDCCNYIPISSGGAGGDGRTYVAFYDSFTGNNPESSSSVKRVYPSGTPIQVKFFDKVGTNSFAESSTYTDICELCHTMTNHFRNKVGAPDQNHTQPESNIPIPGGDCISCHTHSSGFFESAAGCLDCHSVQQGGRAAISSQFSGNSHHIQGAAAVSNSQCYQCHWEANADGSINSTYHEGFNPDVQWDDPNRSTPGAKVDLVIYGTGTRPTTYTVGTTAVQYTANETRSEIKKINTHCLGCHSAKNNTATPFGDGKTPNQYAWDSKSIDERYSQTGTTAWGKYSGGNFTSKNTQTKAYSAHGNATNNQGGWDLSETWPNKRNGSQIVACFDCHNSHGSTVSGTTTSYTSTTTNGGILKDTEAGTGGYSMTYKPQAGGSSANHNVYNAGAGLCFDCHMTASSGTTPWGYQGTFGETQAIKGYWDTKYFGPGTFTSQQRFSYKANPLKGGHFGVSSALSSTPTHTINGLCTPCHDPHGVSPTLGANMQYSVPMLKGTWLTSLYKEDYAPANNVAATARSDQGMEGVHFHIDQNTFGTSLTSSVTGITQTDTQFGGLCMSCHPKNTLTDGTTHTWKSKDRVHESVKGWKTADATIEHNYPCSKCHTPHESFLPRLMVTNCLDYRHKGQMTNNTSAVYSGSGGAIQGYHYGPPCTFTGADCSHSSWNEYYCNCTGYGVGGGGIAGHWATASCNGNCNGWGPYTMISHGTTCHENNASDQKWNNVTRWTQDAGRTVITSGPDAQAPYAEGTTINVIITWTTSTVSTSYVDYGLTTNYGSTTGNGSQVTSHSITLSGLTNHSTYHYRVRSSNVTEAVSEDNTIYVSLPPSVPVLQAQPDIETTEPTPITFVWSTSTNPGGGGAVQYYIEVGHDPSFSNPEFHLGWISGTSSTFTLPPGYWYWRVKARDSIHIDSESTSSVDFFMTLTAMPAPTLIHEPDTVPNVTITLEWNPVTSPDGDPVEYYAECSYWSSFSNPIGSSGWISGTSFTVTLSPAAFTYYWRVQARDAVETDAVSPWSTDSFGAYTAPAAPTLVSEPDIVTTVPTAVTLQWNAVTCSNGDPVEYYVEVDNDPAYGSSPYTSGWISGTNFTVTLPPGYWYWKVRARDAAHTPVVSPWSSSDFFRTMSPPAAPTLIPEPDIVSTVPVDVTLEWDSALSPDGDPLQYDVQVDDQCVFGGSTIDYESGWISGNCTGGKCSWTVTAVPTAKTWCWRVQARDAIQIDALSAWSTADSFNIFTSGAPPAPTLIHEPDSMVNVPVTLEWNPVTDPEGDPVEYYVEYSLYPALWWPTSSGWISGTSFTVTFTTTGTKYWRVYARDANHTDAVSPWSTVDSFVIH